MAGEQLRLKPSGSLPSGLKLMLRILGQVTKSDPSAQKAKTSYPAPTAHTQQTPDSSANMTQILLPQRHQAPDDDQVSVQIGKVAQDILAAADTESDRFDLTRAPRIRHLVRNALLAQALLTAVSPGVTGRGSNKEEKRELLGLLQALHRQSNRCCCNETCMKNISFSQLPSIVQSKPPLQTCLALATNRSYLIGIVHSGRWMHIVYGLLSSEEKSLPLSIMFSGLETS